MQNEARVKIKKNIPFGSPKCPLEVIKEKKNKRRSMRLLLILYSSTFEFLLPLKTAKVYTFPRSLMTLKITELFSRQCSAEIRLSLFLTVPI